MNDLFLIACGAGLQDGLNPCIFMTCAVFIAYGLWLKRSFRMGWWCLVFGLLYGASTLFFNFGPAQLFVLQKNFVLFGKVLYLVLSSGALIAGILFFKDWYLIAVHRKPLSDVPAGEGRKSFLGSALGVFLTTIVLGIGLSAFATIWPIDKYIIVLGNVAIIKGQWQSVMALLVVYVLISMWPLWLVWAFLSIKNLRPSLLKIACASVFLTASSCMILIFK